LPEESLALAFATLYRASADQTFPHFVTVKDRETTYIAVRELLRQRRDVLGEMHLGFEVFEREEEALAESIVSHAAEIFLQI